MQWRYPRLGFSLSFIVYNLDNAAIDEDFVSCVDVWWYAMANLFSASFGLQDPTQGPNCLFCSRVMLPFDAHTSGPDWGCWRQDR